jgi:hypothetical protein
MSGRFIPTSLTRASGTGQTRSDRTPATRRNRLSKRRSTGVMIPRTPATFPRKLPMKMVLLNQSRFRACVLHNMNLCFGGILRSSVTHRTLRHTRSESERYPLVAVLGWLLKF